MNDFLIERMIKKFMENNSYHAIIEAYEANNIKVCVRDGGRHPRVPCRRSLPTAA